MPMPSLAAREHQCEQCSVAFSFQSRAQFHEAPVKRLWLRHFDEYPTTPSSRCASLAPPDESGIHDLSHGLLFSITAKPDSLG
jgi:hypothetical protein